jgi:hypothetical protein
MKNPCEDEENACGCLVSSVVLFIIWACGVVSYAVFHFTVNGN